MQELIQKAIEGGWGSSSWVVVRFTRGKEKVLFHVDGYFSPFYKQTSSIFLDPFFWRALGKSLGWKEKIFIAEDPYMETSDLDVYQETWLYHWHRFIDHIASGKDADSFFKDLLTKTTEI